MKEVCAVIDIGKTNKKIFLFDRDFEVAYKNSVRFEEIEDDDGFSCDDIDKIEIWIKKEILKILEDERYDLKAINFSTHGATLVYLDENGDRITPLYNYLKPLDFDFSGFYQKYGGKEEFSRKTASPAYGMLNAGLQMYWLKNTKPHYWSKVKSILHYPQYLSYLFSNQIKADYTSIGAHTATWDFDNMQYHSWLNSENIELPEPSDGKEASSGIVNGKKIAIGSGVHDSTSSIIPLLEKHKESSKEFVLLSTGTWIICMNPFSKEILTQSQLKNDCLCFMTPEKYQIKSNMQFLGKVHEDESKELSTYFGESEEYFLNLKLDKKYCSTIIDEDKQIFFSRDHNSQEGKNSTNLAQFESYEHAYYQLIFEISLKVANGIRLILDENNNLENIYISGGFRKNDIFLEFLVQFFPQQKIQLSDDRNSSALGAAMLMREYL